MSKSPDAFRTISEVADWLDKPAHVLRFWESKFTQVKPVKRAGGRRYYRPDDMMLLGGIKTLLHDDGMTIKGVQKILREQGVKHVCSLSQPIDAPGSGEDTAPIEARATVPPPPGEAAASFDVPETQTSAEVLRFDQDSAEDVRPPEPATPEVGTAPEQHSEAATPQTPVTTVDAGPAQEAPAEPTAQPAAPQSGTTADPAPADPQGDAVNAKQPADPSTITEEPHDALLAPQTPQAAESTDEAVSDGNEPVQSEAEEDGTSANSKPPNADLLPAFMRAPLLPAPPPSDPEPSADAPKPIAVDVPPLEEFDPEPGVLSAALRAQGVDLAGNKDDLAAAHSRLGQLRDKILQRAKD